MNTKRGALREGCSTFSAARAQPQHQDDPASAAVQSFFETWIA